MNTNARNKLRSMGGIMASSPELMRAAQGYQDGGPVMSAPPMIPRVDPVTMPGTGAPVVGLGRVPPMQPGRPPIADRVPEAGVSYRQMVESATIPSQADLDARFQASQKRADVFPETDSAFTALPPEYLTVPLVGEQLDIPERTPSPHPDYTGPVANETDRAIADFLGDYVIDPSFSAAEGIGRLIEKAAPAKASAADSAAAQEREPGTTPAPLRPVYDNPVFMENLLPPGAEEPDRAQRIKKRAEEELSKDAETTAPQPDTSGGDTGTGTGTGGGGKTTKKDLRSRYKEKIALFKEIYGEDDEERARDKAMSLAMMGLAIASGQSPDALTNIAQGAAVGLQGMSEQERARREQERGLQTLALESAIAEQQGEAEAVARAAEQKAEFQNRKDVARIRQGGGKTSGLNRDDTPADVYNAAFSTLGRTMSAEEARQEALRQAQDHLVLISPRLTEKQLKAELAALQSLAASQADPVQTWITKRREQNVSDEKIRELLKKEGHEPEDYGL